MITVNKYIYYKNVTVYDMKQNTSSLLYLQKNMSEI